MKNLLDLPDELLQRIIQFENLPKNGLLLAGTISRRFLQICVEEYYKRFFFNFQDNATCISFLMKRSELIRKIIFSNIQNGFIFLPDFPSEIILERCDGKIDLRSVYDTIENILLIDTLIYPPLNLNKIPKLKSLIIDFTSKIDIPLFFESLQSFKTKFKMTIGTYYIELIRI